MTRKDSIDNLVRFVEIRDYGDVIDHTQISHIIQHRYGTKEYNSIVQAAKKRLEVSGHAITSERGLGYKVCQPNEYTSEGVRYMRQGAKRIDRGVKVLSHAPVSDMSPEARAAHNCVSDRMMRLQAALAGASVEIHMLNKNKNPLIEAK